MATISDKINQGLTNLYTSPLGMASLGLLMQPSMSRTPINPWQYAAQGMQLGIQNRAQQQQIQEERARQAENDQMLRARYLMDIQRFQNERIQQEQAAVQAERERAAMREFMSTLSPEEARIAAVLGPEYAKQMMAQRQPKQTTLMQNLIAAGLQPGTPEFQAAMMQGVMRPQIQIGPTEKPYSPSDLARMQRPGGGAPPIGLTPSEAARQGYSVTPAPPPMTPEEQIEFKQQESQAQLSAKQQFANQQAVGAVQRLNDFISNLGPSAALTPTVRAQYSSMLDAAANAIAKARGTPGAEPPAQAIDRARESLPRIEELMVGPIIGDTVNAKMSALLSELGGGGPAMTTPAGTKVTTDMKSGWQQIAPNVRMRRK